MNSFLVNNFSFLYSLFKDTMPPLSGVTRKNVLQKSSDVNKLEHTEPNIEPIANPVVLDVDEYPKFFLQHKTVSINNSGVTNIKILSSYYRLIPIHKYYFIFIFYIDVLPKNPPNMSLKKFIKT